MRLRQNDLGSRIGVGRSAEVFALDDRYALKLFHTGVDRQAAEREIAFTQLATRWDLPTARFHEAVELDGRRGFILDRVHGDPLLTRIAREPEELETHARAFAELHRRLHAVQVSDGPSFRDCLAGQIRRAPGLGTALRDQVLALMNGIPDTTAVLCHGDFHPENVLVSDQRLVVIDWANACSGCAATDCARTALMLGIGAPVAPDPKVMAIVARGRDAFLRSYRRHCIGDTAARQTAVAQWMPVVAAARLAEGIEDEHARLLSIVQAACGA